MTLLNITDVQDDTAADANDLNIRFTQVSQVVNGNIDAQNLLDSAVTSGKLASSSVTSTKLAPGVTQDANGWTVFDMGTFKMYKKKVTTTLSGFNGPAFVTALSSPLPVGIANYNAMLGFDATFTYNSSGSIRFTEESFGTDTSINVVGTTTSSTSSSVTAYYSVIA